jgi:hypothetical protein
VSFLKPMKDMMPVPGLRAHIHSVLNAYELERPYKRIHASALTNENKAYCPKEIILRDILDTKLENVRHGTCLRYTFDLGDAIHDMLREKWAVDIAVGDWKCQNCGKVHEFQLKPSKCDHCYSPNFKYDEVRFECLQTRADGGIDLIVKLNGQDKYVIVEIKSIDKDQFKKLDFPKGEHRIRTQMYMQLVERSESKHLGHINIEKALIIYCVKGYGNKDGTLYSENINEYMSPFKEFWVSRDDTATQPYFDKAETVTKARKTKVIPSGICDTGMCKRAKECPVSVDCFSGKYNQGDSYE